MRVCFITGEYPPQRGGVGDYTARLRQALEETGVETTVVTSKAAAAEGPRTWAAIEGWGFGSWPRLVHLLAQAQAQIAHLQYQTGAFAMHPAVNLLPFFLRRRWPQGRFITTFHDLRVPYLFPKAGPLRSYVNRLLLRHSHAAILITEEDLAQAKVWARPGQPLRLISIGSNLLPPAESDPQAARHALGVKEEEFLLGFFGFLTPEKGLEELFAAVAQLRERGYRVRLAMIGGAAADTSIIDYHRQVRAQAASLGLGDAVRWTGFLEPEAASAHLLACDAIALPFTTGASFRHGSLMAALTHGRPLVTTLQQAQGGAQPQHPALRQAQDNALRPPEADQDAASGDGPHLMDGRNCLLVPSGDAAALSVAVQRLIASPELRHSLAQGARALAQSFTWEAIAGRTAELYREVLEAAE